DYWVGGERLCDSFPRIAAASQSLESNIFDLLLYVDGRRHWRIPLSTTLRGGTLLEWNRLHQQLADLLERRITEGPANIYWPLEASALFTVKSLSKRLADEMFLGVPNFPDKVIWSKCVPTKVQSFVWMAWHKKIATIENLQRRGMQLTNMCVLCYKDLETVNHIMLTCEFASNVWNKLSSGLSIFGPTSVDITDFVLGWKVMNCNPNFSVVMKCLLHATLWFIWIERNNRIFKEKALSHKQVAIKILINMGNWLGATSMFSQEDMICWNRFVFVPG
ncbi:hypothetical protein LINPERHAP1_LOCUS39565, partial [Linum perenne]